MLLTVMTYNIHSCIGEDGVDSPARIARIIKEQNADIISLQELDMGLVRSGRVDQAKLLADMLEMNYLFHPSIHFEAGLYGNAVLSPHPIKLFHAGELPTLPKRKIKERRGALWIKLDLAGTTIEIFNTHLGLNRYERLAQAMALTGSEWTRHPDCRGPVIFCGDINARRHSKVCKIFRQFLVELHSKKTWPSRLPLMKIDHIFISPDIKVKKVAVIKNELTRRASDHLPLWALLDVPTGRM